MPGKFFRSPFTGGRGDPGMLARIGVVAYLSRARLRTKSQHSSPALALSRRSRGAAEPTETSMARATKTAFARNMPPSTVKAPNPRPQDDQLRLGRSRRISRKTDGPSVSRRLRVARSSVVTVESPIRSIWLPARVAARSCNVFEAGTASCAVKPISRSLHIASTRVDASCSPAQRSIRLTSSMGSRTAAVDVASDDPE